MNLKKLVQETSSGPGRVFDITIQALIILSLVTFSISTIPDLSERALLILSILEIVTVVFFPLNIFSEFMQQRRNWIIFSVFTELSIYWPFSLFI